MSTIHIGIIREGKTPPDFRVPHGKFPAVMISAVPTGMRKVNKFLFGISLGTV
jgi:hypothetical protein